MKEFLAYWKVDFYTGIISFFLAVAGLIVSLKKKENDKLKPLAFFFLAYVLMESIGVINRATHLYKPLRIKIALYVDLVVTIVEFLTFFSVIRNYITNDKIKKALTPLRPLFISATTIYFIYYIIAYNLHDQYFLQIVFTIEALLLVVACSFYYIDIFTKKPKTELTQDPSFWVVTGVAFFMLCTLPFSMVGLYLVKVNFHLYVQLFAVFEVFYWILFLMIIKAYFCKPLTA